MTSSNDEFQNDDDLSDYVPPENSKERDEEFDEPIRKKRKVTKRTRKKIGSKKPPLADRVKRAEKRRLKEAEKKKWNITDQQRRRYNARKEEVRRYRLANETEEEREERLMKRRMLMRNYMQKRLQNESPEERKKRLEGARIRAHNNRQKVKMAPNGIMEGVEEPADVQEESGWWSDGEMSDGFEKFYDKAMEEEDKEFLDIIDPPKTKKKKSEKKQKKDVDPETARIRKLYRVRHKLKTESHAMCYFCLNPLDDGKIPISSVKKRIEDYGPTIVQSEIIPKNLCYECSHQISQALDTYDMLIKSQQYWDTILGNIELKRSGARSNPKLCENVEEEKSGYDHIFTVAEPVPHIQTEIPDQKAESIDDAEFQFMCRICLVGFMDAAAITLHAILAHKVATKSMIGAQICAHRTIRQIHNPYCVKCWAIFEDEVEHERHKEDCKIPLKDQPFTPGWQKPFECEKCGKKYFNRTVLQRHYDLVCFKKQEAVEKLRTPCPDCGKVYATVQAMRLHRDSVHAENRTTHICEKCGKEYLVLKCLEIHRLSCDSQPQPQKTSEPIRPFSCNACFKSFIGKDQLEAHVNRVHIKRQTYSCRFCSKGFYQNKNRLVHESRIHAKTRNVACKLCDKEFFLMYDLKSHALNVHNMNPNVPEFKEKIVRLITCEEKEQRIRRAMEKYQCDQCGNGFPTEAFLAQHRTNGCQPIELDLFGQGVGFMRHTCTKCERWFKTKERLDQHYNRGCEDDDPPLTVIYGKPNRKKIQMDSDAGMEIV